MNDHACQPVVQPASGPSIDPARLIEANINPVTGLATDYLNHFNEAIMMLELIPAMPECVDDLMGWRVMSYCEHFMSTHQKHRDLVPIVRSIPQYVFPVQPEVIPSCFIF